MTTAKKAAKHKLESALLLKLQSDHGYMMQELRSKKERTGIIAGPTFVGAVRRIVLSVPSDSALGIALHKADETNKTKLVKVKPTKRKAKR